MYLYSIPIKDKEIYEKVWEWKPPEGRKKIYSVYYLLMKLKAFKKVIFFFFLAKKV